jgi:hypothetical protein
MTSLYDTFQPPFHIDPVLTQGVDRPAIFVLKDEAHAALGGFQDEAIGNAVVDALNEHAEIRAAMRRDLPLMRRVMHAIEQRSAPESL